jgi:2-polyprenyl-6-methoxyphenol hydroxylase-like FAD-dependent oxidoreductase
MGATAELRTTCCIAGGGPAGMMLGLLLARAGVEVVVLEKHADFFRDFRGDTIHPSTLELIYELGYLEDFLKLPLQKVETVHATFGDFEVTMADFRHLPVHCKFLGFIPQWDFLDFIAEKAKKYPTFHLKLEHEVVDLIRRGKRVVGVKIKTKEGELDVFADLVVGADGRGSCVRDRSGLEVVDHGAPFDVLWMRLSREESDPNESLGNVQAGKMLVMINRKDYWQCGYLIPKGLFEEIKKQGLRAFQKQVADTAPSLRDRVHELDNWDKIKLLTVQINRLTRWHLPGLLCIGDAAHAMSPMGGVGINLAIQDAVAAANILAEPLRLGEASEEKLTRVQERRTWPTAMIQRLQIFLQETFLLHVLTSHEKLKVPLFPKLVQHIPLLRRIPARIIGMGPRPEHIRTPDAFK